MPENNRLLIIEDNSRLRKELVIFLCGNGYICEAPDAFDTIATTSAFSEFNLILLDINLPSVDGFYLCRRIRACSNVPIIVVTSRDTEMDELMAMNLGADDYITKPYHPQILLARIASVMKRVYKEIKPDTDRIVYGDVELLSSRSRVSYNGMSVDLTRNELRILASLIETPGVIITRDELMNQLWNNDLFIDDNTLTVNMNRLRGKLAEIGLENVIMTRRGQGYCLKVIADP